MKITKQKLKQIIKEELEEAYGGALGPFPDRYGDAHKQQAGLTPDELENFLDTYVVDNPLYSLDGEASKSLFAGYMQSIGRTPPDVEALQDIYDSLARNMDPEDRSHMSDLMEIIKEELGEVFGEEAESRWWVDEMRRLITEIDQLHKAIKGDHPDDLELFEDYLNQNIELTTQAWQEDRQPPAEEESEWELET